MWRLSRKSELWHYATPLFSLHARFHSISWYKLLIFFRNYFYFMFQYLGSLIFSYFPKTSFTFSMSSPRDTVLDHLFPKFAVLWCVQLPIILWFFALCKEAVAFLGNSFCLHLISENNFAVFSSWCCNSFTFSLRIYIFLVAEFMNAPWMF